MIPKDYITEWRRQAPWVEDAQVELDLVMSRVVVELFRNEKLAAQLAFRGGTAINKLYNQPPVRYSEDIDFVHVVPGPIGETLDTVRGVLDTWLGTPRRQFKAGRVNLIYRFDSEDEPPLRLRLKIEINSREHFAELGLVRVPFEVQSRWFHGAANVTTYTLEELLGTKLRALYQRKKGRDLFDLWHGLVNGGADAERIVACFLRYMREANQEVTRAQFEENLAGKLLAPSFAADIAPLLRPRVGWDLANAASTVLEQLLAQLPGDPWKGEGSVEPAVPE